MGRVTALLISNKAFSEKLVLKNKRPSNLPLTNAKFSLKVCRRTRREKLITIYRRKLNQ